VVAMYGTCWHDTAQRTDVWTDGSATTTGLRRAGAGVFWGIYHERNVSVRVPGESQTNNHAELYAVLCAIRMAKPARTLRIHTDSQYAIHSVCHWAARFSQLGWRHANSDLIRTIANHIRARTAPVQFYWIKGHAGNVHNEHADQLA
ncbi:ribonuclease H-like protein, partial [Trametes coccinea BRFM310]